MGHYNLTLEIHNAAPGGAQVLVSTDILADKATAAETGAELGKLAEAIIKKEG